MPDGRGFTLIEMIAAILVLAAIGLFSTQFVSFGARTYSDVAGRQQLLAQSRFALERLTRELRDAVPNSQFVSNAGRCINFVPIVASGAYAQLPIAPAVADHGVLIDFIDAPLVQHGDRLWLYPLSTAHVYDPLEQRYASISCAGPDCLPDADVNHEIPVTFDASAGPVQFVTASPAQRFYIGRSQVSYCADTDRLERSETALATGAVSGPYLMAEQLDQNMVAYPPFRYVEPSLLRSAVVLIDLRFSRATGSEPFRFIHEVHLPNVP